MLSKFFYGVILFGLVLWFITKSLKIGLLPIIIYLFIRILVNVLIGLSEAQNKHQF